MKAKVYERVVVNCPLKKHTMFINNICSHGNNESFYVMEAMAITRCYVVNMYIECRRPKARISSRTLSFTVGFNPPSICSI